MRVHRRHDRDEDGQAQPPVGEDLVQPGGPAVLGFVGMPEHFGDQPVGEAVAAFGDQGGGVGPQVLLQELGAAPALGLDRLAGVAGLGQGHGVRGAFQQAQGDPARQVLMGQLFVPVDLRFQLGQLAFDIRAERGAHRPDPQVLAPGHAEDGRLELRHAFAPVAHGGDHRAAQQGLQAGDVQGHALPFGVVHHVQDEHHRLLQLEHLGGEVEVAFQVGGVQHVDDDVHHRFGQEGGGDPFVLALGRQGVGSRQVHHLDLHAGLFEMAEALLHGHPGPVGHVVPGSGQRVEDGSLAAVGIPGDGHGGHRLTGGLGGRLRPLLDLGGKGGKDWAHGRTFALGEIEEVEVIFALDSS